MQSGFVAEIVPCTVLTMATCPGSLILHRGGSVVGCILDELDDDNKCRGLELRHEGDPQECWRVFGGCNVCGIQEPTC